MKNILALAIVAIASSSFAVTFTSAAPVGALADFATPNPGVTSSTINIGTGIASVESITLRGVDHTWIGDLVITVTAPDLSVLTLVNRAGKTSPTSGFGSSFKFVNADLIFQVGGANLWTAAGANVTGGTFAPSTNLFGGTVLTSYSATTFAAGANQAAGNWTLTISDLASGDTGTAGNWEINATPVPEPATMTAMALGLAAIARRRKNA